MMNWISVNDRLPDQSDEPVLAVRELKNGERQICIARCILKYSHYNPFTRTNRVGPYWICIGNNNVIYWMPLPEIPTEKEGENNAGHAD